MAVFTNKEFIEKLEWLVNDIPNIYWSENGTWCTLYDNKWRMDCVCSIKGLLWGFKADKRQKHGGAIYGSNGVADFTANGGIDYCDNIGQDFSKLEIGEYLCMWGTPYEHAGIYLGNGKVFECTTEWGANRCIISDIDKNGKRTYNGMGSVANWTWHGKLKYIEYLEKQKIKLRGHIEEIGWTQWQDNFCGTTGQNKRLEAFQIDAPDYKIKVKAHIQDLSWIDYGEINKDTVIGTTGQGKRIEALQIIADGLEYQVHIENLGWSNMTPAKELYSIGTMGYGKKIEALYLK